MRERRGASWSDLASIGVVFSAVLVFISFAVSYGQIKVVDDSLVGIFDQSSMLVNFYAISQSLIAFLMIMVWNIWFLVDIRNHKATLIEIFTKFRQVGWAKAITYFVLPIVWVLSATDKYDLSARCLLVFALIVFASIRYLHQKNESSDFLNLVTSNLVAYISLFNLLFLSLVNFGSHLTYEKIANFNNVIGVNRSIDGINRKVVVIYSSPSNMILFDGEKFSIISDLFLHIEKSFTDTPVRRESYLQRIVS